MTPSTIAPSVPSGAAGQYRARRAAGSDHDKAIAETEHAFGRRDLGEKLGRVRDELVREQNAQVEPDPEPIVVEEPAMDAATAEIAGRIETLTAERQALALDCLHSSARASDLVKVEAALAAARLELERIPLAAAELLRRQSAADEHAQHEARAAAKGRADVLGADAVKLWASKVQPAATAFAQAIAEHNRICTAQASQLEAAGQTEARRRTVPGDAALQGVLADACLTAGAPGRFLSS
jgi:hypothetical protein